MHILILSQYYAPEPILKPIELANELKRLGHEVSVITGFPNYPSGELYPGYKLKFVETTIENDIRITRTYEYPYHGKSVVGRIINYISFMLSAPFGLITNSDIDVIYVWHPPLTIGISAWIISLLSGKAYVYDVQDIWPESVIVSGLVKSKLLIKLLRAIESFVYKKANSIIVVTKGAKNNLIEKGVDGNKIKILPHWIDENLFCSFDQDDIERIKKLYNFDNKFVCMFAGNLGTVQGLDTLIFAADMLREEDDILIVFVGEGSDGPRLKELVTSLNLEKLVIFIDQKPINEIPAFLSASNVLLVHLKSSPLSNYVIPSKTIAYLAAGKPILMAAGGASGQLIEEIGAGISINPGDPKQLAESILMLAGKSLDDLEKMGDKGRQYFLTHLAKSEVIPMYESLLIDVAEDK